MARDGPVTAFHFEGRSSLVQRWDVRFRVAVSALACWGVLSSLGAGVILWSVLLGAALALAGMRLAELGSLLRRFAGFFVFFFVLSWAFEPTAAQAELLGIQIVKLFLLLLCGQFVYLPSTPGNTVEGVRWFLGFMGRRRAWNAANMASWALASVPLILDQAQTLRESASLRGLTVKRHPLRFFKLLTLGLLIRTVERSADLAQALEARSFGLEVPLSGLKSRGRDWLWLGVAGGLTFAAAALDGILRP